MMKREKSIALKERTKPTKKKRNKAPEHVLFAEIDSKKD